MRIIAAVAATLVVHSLGVAGPLGLEMGTPLKALQSKIKLKPEGPYQFSATALPDGHPEFNDYRLLVTPQHGLCKFTAWTPPVRTSVYGTELLAKFDRFFNVLSTKYGVAQRFDFLESGSIWSDGRDWMMALRKKERNLSAYWTDKDLSLPDNLAAIKIEAYASTTESGMIAIGYEFKNASDCIDWIQSSKDSKL